MIGMTKRQADCLRAIEDLTVAGMSPTYDQIGARIGLVGKGGVCRIVDALVERGLVRRKAHRPRALEVVYPAAPSKTKTQIADEICRRVWERNRSGMKVEREDLHSFIMEALR